MNTKELTPPTPLAVLVSDVNSDAARRMVEAIERLHAPARVHVVDDAKIFFSGVELTGFAEGIEIGFERHDFKLRDIEPVHHREWRRARNARKRRHRKHRGK